MCYDKGLMFNVMSRCKGVGIETAFIMYCKNPCSMWTHKTQPCKIRSDFMSKTNIKLHLTI